MAFAGIGTLLGVGVATWFVRVPFEPVVGVTGGDAGSLVNELLTNVFCRSGPGGCDRPGRDG